MRKVFPIWLIAIMWAVFVIDLVLPVDLVAFGIRPRELTGLFGIVIAPFLHASLFHIVNNTIAMAVLGYLFVLSEHRHYLAVTVAIAVLSGAATWLISGAGVVVGISGVICGYWAFILTSAILALLGRIDEPFSRVALRLIAAIGAMVLYGGMLFVIIDIRQHISWAAHVTGLVAGVLMAFAVTGKNDTLVEQ